MSNVNQFPKLSCCGHTPVPDADWIRMHMEKCLNRAVCIGCGKKTAWPGMSGRNADRCNNCMVPSPYKDIDFDPESRGF